MQPGQRVTVHNMPSCRLIGDAFMYAETLVLFVNDGNDRSSQSAIVGFVVDLLTV